MPERVNVCRACGRLQGALVGAPSPHLECAVRGEAEAPPAALLQHLRVELLLILLQDVRQVRATAALRVVLIPRAVVSLAQRGKPY